MSRRIIFIHGRAEKPREEDKEQLLREALAHGLSRVGASLEGIKFDLAYYGDVNNAILWGKEERQRMAPDFLAWNFPYEPVDKYREPLDMLFARATEDQSKSEFRALKRTLKDEGLLDNVFDVVSPVVNFFGLGDNVLNGLLADLGAYFRYRIVGSVVRQRLQRILVPALENGDDICLIAHSMGTAVAYDVLWKLSRMSEYMNVRSRKVSLFVTLGSPLGETGIRKQLYDWGESEDGLYPTNIRSWHNFTAADDFVAHDEDLADDFREMLERGYVDAIEDHDIYTFYVGAGGSLNPHKSYGYLDNAEVAEAIADWID